MRREREMMATTDVIPAYGGFQLSHDALEEDSQP